MSDNLLQLTPIARVRSPYREKFGIPRQSRLSNTARGEIVLLPPFNRAEALEGIEEFSHLWLLWLFDRNPPTSEFKASVRPPRLGGNTRRGVFATRSPVRPNPIGLSAVELINTDKEHAVLTVAGLDLADDTAIVDIKPYIPYSDSIPDANGGFAHGRPDAHLDVSFSQTSLDSLNKIDDAAYLQSLIEESISQDPRPAYHGNDPTRVYYLRLDGYEISFRVEDDQATVDKISAQ